MTHCYLLILMFILLCFDEGRCSTLLDDYAHAHAAEFSICGENVTEMFFFKAHHRVELCCSASDPQTCRQNMNDSLFIYSHPLQRSDTDTVTNHWPLQHNFDLCNVKLIITDPQVSDTGDFFCDWKIEKTRASFATVTFVGKPDDPKILQLSLRPNTKDIVIVFDPGKLDTNIFHFYEVQFEDNNGRPFKAVTCKEVQCRGQICNCSCEINQYFKNVVLFSEEVCILIHKNKSLYKDQWETKVSFMKHVLPGQVTSLTAKSKVTNAIVTWGLPKKMMDLVAFMKVEGFPLHYNINLTKCQGGFEKRIYNIEAAQYFKKYISLRIGDLTPNTEYRVEIVAIGGSGHGKSVIKNFTTKQAGPSATPDRGSIMYSVVREFSQNFAVFVMWKPPPHDLQGGPLSYDLKVLTSDNMNITKRISVPYFVVRNVPPGYLRVEIQTVVKDKGHAEGTTTFDIPVGPTKIKTCENLELVNNTVVNKDQTKTVPLYRCEGFKHPDIPALDMCLQYPMLGSMQHNEWEWERKSSVEKHKELFTSTDAGVHGLKTTFHTITVYDHYKKSLKTSIGERKTNVTVMKSPEVLDNCKLEKMKKGNSPVPTIILNRNGNVILKNVENPIGQLQLQFFVSQQSQSLIPYTEYLSQCENELSESDFKEQGISAGVSIGLVITLIIVVCFCIRYRNRKRKMEKLIKHAIQPSLVLSSHEHDSNIDLFPQNSSQTYPDNEAGSHMLSDSGVNQSGNIDGDDGHYSDFCMVIVPGCKSDSGNCDDGHYNSFHKVIIQGNQSNSGTNQVSVSDRSSEPDDLSDVRNQNFYPKGTVNDIHHNSEPESNMEEVDIDSSGTNQSWDESMQYSSHYNAMDEVLIPTGHAVNC